MFFERQSVCMDASLCLHPTSFGTEMIFDSLVLSIRPFDKHSMVMLRSTNYIVCTYNNFIKDIVSTKHCTYVSDNLFRI